MHIHPVSVRKLSQAMRQAACLFGLLVSTTNVAFAQASPYSTPQPIELKEGFALEKQTLTEREIPVLLLSKKKFADEEKPVVFLVHGGGMPDVLSKNDPWAKEGWFDAKYHDVPYTLAEGGILVVLMDHWWAGERYKPEYRDVVKKNYLGSVVRGFIETAKDIPLLIDAMSSVDGADVSRIGVTGRSGGGIVSLMATALDPRVTAITSWVGGPDLMEFARSKMPQRTIDHFLKGAPEIITLLDEYDPIHRFSTMPPTAILMMNNRNDPAVPVATAEAMYQLLKPLYADSPENLKLHILDPAEPTHAMTKENYDEGCAWLIEHLTEKRR